MKQQIYDLWDRIDNVMIQMPTGTGKTIVYTFHTPSGKIEKRLTWNGNKFTTDNNQ